MCQSQGQAAPVRFAARPEPGGHGACATTSTNVGRVIDASHDLDFPEVPFPSPDFLRQVGEVALRQLVRRHHDLLRSSEISHMLATDDAEYAAAVEKIADFVVESCGGAQRYTETQGKGCMRTRHFPFTIDEKGRDIWLDCLWQALDDSELSHALRLEYWSWLEPFSIRMINRRTLRTQPRRYPFNMVQLCMARAPFAVCPR
jgi:hemoglobin